MEARGRETGDKKLAGQMRGGKTEMLRTNKTRLDLACKTEFKQTLTLMLASAGLSAGLKHFSMRHAPRACRL